eukprot:4224791-Pleurochrysis_carterae.AAC.1
MMVLMERAETPPRLAREVCTPHQPYLRTISGKSRRKMREEAQPTAESTEESSAAPSLPKSSANMANGSETGSAMVAPATDASTVLVP